MTNEDEISEDTFSEAASIMYSLNENVYDSLKELNLKFKNKKFIKRDIDLLAVLSFYVKQHFDKDKFGSVASSSFYDSDDKVYNKAIAELEFLIGRNKSKFDIVYRDVVKDVKNGSYERLIKEIRFFFNDPNRIPKGYIA